MAIVETRPSGGFMNWVNERRAAATMQSDDIALNQVRNWNTFGIPEVPRVIKNADTDGRSRFMEFVGRRIWPKGKEKDSHDQISIREVKDPTDPKGYAGTAGLVVDKFTGEILIQSAEESDAGVPGSPPSEYLTLRPTLQGSYTNIKEKKIPFSEYADIRDFDKDVQVNPSRIHGKVRVGLVFVDKNDIDLTDKPNFAWFTREQLHEGVRENAPINGFLHAALDQYDEYYHRLAAKEAAKEHDGGKGKHAVTDRAHKKSLLDIQQGTGAVDSLSLSHLREKAAEKFELPKWLKWLNPKNWFKKSGGHH
jgi:hypothetical protein